MKSHFKLTGGMSLLGLLAIILMISSPIAAVPSNAPTLGTNAYDTAPNLEFGNIVAGIGQAVYASMYSFGGSDGSAIPLDTSATAFAQADNWLVLFVNQSTYSNYLDQAPSPVGAPDGLSFHVVYPVATSDANAVTYAFDAASAVATQYGVTFSVVNFDLASNSFSFIAVNSNNATVADSVASDVTGLSTGLTTLLNANTITSSPVFWSAYGARHFVGNHVVQAGAGWVDPSGLQDMGSGVYKLDSKTVFGGDVHATTVRPALSRVTFTVPYPIEPIANGISPATSNPLPHVTGIAQWDLVHPVWGDIAATEFQMSFKLKQDTAFPNIQNEFTVNQTKLNKDGILEAKFKVTNVGSEEAKNVEVALPLGQGFKHFAEDTNASIYKIDSTKYHLDTTFNVNFGLTATVPVVGEVVNEQFLDFSGWYFNTSNVADGWDFTTTSLDFTINSVAISITSDNGFPQFLVDLVNTQLQADISSISATNAKTVLSNALIKLVNATKNDVLNKYYVKEEIFRVYNGDFNLETIPYGGANPNAALDFSFYHATIPSLAIGESKTLSFRIENVPVYTDNFQFMDFSVTPATGGTGDFLPNATIVSHNENWYSVMQYMFQLHGFDGRPLSWGLNANVTFGVGSSLGLDSYVADTYVSHGAFVRYENAQGFPFFSMSNAQNIQIADDEAIVSGVLSLDKQVYHPGENQTITLNLTNTGDIPAENLKVHIYHASLGRHWSFERTQKITTIDVGELMNGTSQVLTFETPANSFVGYSPVYAYIEFDSDAGQGAQSLRDYFNLGVHEYDAAAQAHQITFSTLTGALLLPEPGQIDLNPTIPSPKVEITKQVSDVGSDNHFTVTYTISNTGKADTTIYFGQSYNTNEVSLVSSSDDANAIKVESAYPQWNFGYVTYSGIQLDAGDSTTITLEFNLLGDSAYLSPAFAYFTLAGESSLGASVNTGTDTNVNTGGSHLKLSADSAAQEDSQKSANEDASSSSYSASSSVGASVNTNVDTNRVNTVNGVAGFVGYDALGFLGLMAIPLTIIPIIKKRNR